MAGVGYIKEKKELRYGSKMEPAIYLYVLKPN